MTSPKKSRHASAKSKRQSPGRAPQNSPRRHAYRTFLQTYAQEHHNSLGRDWMRQAAEEWRARKGLAGGLCVPPFCKKTPETEQAKADIIGFLQKLDRNYWNRDIVYYYYQKSLRSPHPKEYDGPHAVRVIDIINRNHQAVQDLAMDCVHLSSRSEAIQQACSARVRNFKKNLLDLAQSESMPPPLAH